MKTSSLLTIVALACVPTVLSTLSARAESVSMMPPYEGTTVLRGDWNLIQLDGAASTGTLNFEPTALHAKFCNSVNQSYTLSGSAIVPNGPAISTKMYCAGPIMDAEDSFVLEPFATYAVAANQLEIRTAAGHVYRFERPSEEPILCTMEYRPVCGTDGKTYGNACSAGNKVDYTGECTSDKSVANLRRTYGKAFDFAQTYGLTSAASVETFRLRDRITRQEAAKMISNLVENALDKRYASFPDSCNVAYEDESQIASDLRNTVYGACALGAIRWNGGKFRPLANLSRAEALVMMMRAADGWQDEDGAPWWMAYADRAQAIQAITFANFKGMDAPITRGELLQWAYGVGTSKR